MWTSRRALSLSVGRPRSWSGRRCHGVDGEGSSWTLEDVASRCLVLELPKLDDAIVWASLLSAPVAGRRMHRDGGDAVRAGDGGGWPGVAAVLAAPSTASRGRWSLARASRKGLAQQPVATGCVPRARAVRSRSPPQASSQPRGYLRAWRRGRCRFSCSPRGCEEARPRHARLVDFHTGRNVRQVDPEAFTYAGRRAATHKAVPSRSCSSAASCRSPAVNRAASAPPRAPSSRRSASRPWTRTRLVAEPGRACSSLPCVPFAS